MQFAKGYTTRQWWALSMREKLSTLGVAILYVVGPIVGVSLIGIVWIVLVQPWLAQRADNDRMDSLVGLQYQVDVDGSLGTDFPYQYAFDPCLKRWKIVGSTGYTEYRCQGNVRVLASNDVVLGRGDTIIPVHDDGSEITIGIAFGNWHEAIDRKDLRPQ